MQWFPQHDETVPQLKKDAEEWLTGKKNNHEQYEIIYLPIRELHPALKVHLHTSSIFY
jgi:hypothetical protein